jgi:hypothetical protein
MDLERLAREAGLDDSPTFGTFYEVNDEGLAHFAALVLEEAAKALERYDDYELSGNGSAEIVRALKPAASPPRP